MNVVQVWLSTAQIITDYAMSDLHDLEANPTNVLKIMQIGLSHPAQQLAVMLQLVLICRGVLVCLCRAINTRLARSQARPGFAGAASIQVDLLCCLCLRPGMDSFVFGRALSGVLSFLCCGGIGR